MGMHRSLAQRRRLDRNFYASTAVGMLLSGLAIILGPKASPGYAVVRQAPGGLYAWGALFVAAGLGKLVVLATKRWGEWMRYGSTVGAIVTLAWSSALTAAGGKLQGWSSIPVWYTIAGIQLLAASAPHRSSDR